MILSTTQYQAALYLQQYQNWYQKNHLQFRLLIFCNESAALRQYIKKFRKKEEKIYEIE